MTRAVLVPTWLQEFEKEAGYIMTEQVYNAKEFALELGFSEEDAGLFGGVNANATNLRRLAKRRREKGKMPDQLAEKAVGSVTVVATVTPTEVEGKKHKHAYRKDGTCKCGKVKGKRTAAEKEKKTEAKAVKAREAAATEADNRPSYEGKK